MPALRILLIGQVFGGESVGSQLHVMNMTGHERSAAVLLVTSTVVNALVSMIMDPIQFGLTGLGRSRHRDAIVWNAGIAVFHPRHLELLPACSARRASTPQADRARGTLGVPRIGRALSRRLGPEMRIFGTNDISQRRALA